MEKNNRTYLLISLAVIACLLVWFFSSVIFYIIISVFLSIIGRPLVRLLDKIKIYKFRLPHTVSTIITLMAMIAAFYCFILIFIPVISQQAEMLSRIDVNTLSRSMKEPIMLLQNFMIKHRMISQTDTIGAIINEKIMSFVNIMNFSDSLNYIISFAGRMFVSVFAILFMTFFFLKDEHLFYNMVMVFTPDKHRDGINKVLSESKRLLTRYFVGIFLDISIVITLISIGATIIGFKNALMIGFLGAIFNVIPYVGPIIGWIIGMILGVTANLDVDFYTVTMPMLLYLTGVFVATNIFDAIVLQPAIYSKSVKAHPLEIFIVIMVAGSIAGITGMIFAVPTYTFLRIVAKEFFSSFEIVNKFTKRI